MSDSKETIGDGTDKGGAIEGKVPDPEFMMECLKNTEGSLSINVAAVAQALGYKNPVSVRNRINLIKKKYGMEVNCITTRGGGTGSAETTPRKGPTVSRGPIKAKAPPKEGEEAEKPKRGRKPAAKDGEAADKPKRGRKPAAKRGPKAEAEPAPNVEEKAEAEADDENSEE